MINYNSLREIQKKETESAALLTLEKNFYEDVSVYLAKKREEALATKSILVIKEYENIKKIMLTIRNKREEKIVLIALRSGSENTGLTNEEEELVRSLRNQIKQYRKNLDDVLVSEEQVINTRKVKILKDVERYTGLNNNIYGPFRIGEEQMLPLQEAEWLLKSKLAESV